MSLRVIQFPDKDINDIPGTLRKLADQIEAGDYDDAHNLAWVIDCGDSRIEVGMMGKAPEPATLAHFLFALGQRKLEGAVL
jgi:hypothetical protein